MCCMDFTNDTEKQDYPAVPQTLSYPTNETKDPNNAVAAVPEIPDTNLMLDLSYATYERSMMANEAALLRQFETLDITRHHRPILRESESLNQNGGWGAPQEAKSSYKSPSRRSRHRRVPTLAEKKQMPYAVPQYRGDFLK